MVGHGWPWFKHSLMHSLSTLAVAHLQQSTYPDPAAVHHRAELFLSSVSWATMARVRRTLGQMSLSSHPVASLCLSKKTVVRLHAALCLELTSFICPFLNYSNRWPVIPLELHTFLSVLRFIPLPS